MYYREENTSKSFTIFKNLIFLLAGVIVAFLLSRLFILPSDIFDASMEPNFSIGEKVLLLKHITPQQGDVILFRNPLQDDRVLLKRIIAVETDTIEIRNKVIYINNKKIKYTWKTTNKDKRIFPMTLTYRDNMPAIKIKRNHYFVLSDNLDNSFDSRNFGLITDDHIIGKVVYHFKNDE